MKNEKNILLLVTILIVGCSKEETLTQIELNNDTVLNIELPDTRWVNDYLNEKISSSSKSTTEEEYVVFNDIVFNYHSSAYNADVYVNENNDWIVTYPEWNYFSTSFNGVHGQLTDDTVKIPSVFQEYIGNEFHEIDGSEFHIEVYQCWIDQLAEVGRYYN